MADTTPLTAEHHTHTLDEGPLGKVTAYPATYTPSLLHPIDRRAARAQVGVTQASQLHGEDLWTGYEFSWLDTQGKPLVAGLRIRIPCQSAAMVESKSLKLYLNSFSQTKFESQAAVLHTLDQDLNLAFQAPVMIELMALSQLSAQVQQLPGVCLDDIDLRTNTYEREPGFLALEDADVSVHETLHSHLFRSLCPVTAQPDWASISIEYTGVPMNRAGLLKYLISYRNHQAFHETTIERIFCDITAACAPSRLAVYGRFLRRGGLDINPFRSSHEADAPLCRLPRQ
ncbi:MAG: NADPH-dependent 7-cyano-7-deazaguanine reductase QueF [bacterium]